MNQNKETTILLHGTSTFYINEIIKNGLNGRFPDELLQKMKNVKKIIGSVGPREGYVQNFFIRQDSVRKTGEVHLSFTTDINVAKEYAGSERVIGEGPTFLANHLLKYLRNDKTLSKLTDEQKVELKNLAFTIFKALKYPGIILAINTDEIKYCKDINAHKKRGPYMTDEYEYTIWCAIKPEDIYIYTDDQKLIKLLPDDGSGYLKSLMSKIPTDELIKKDFMALYEEQIVENELIETIRIIPKPEEEKSLAMVSYNTKDYRQNVKIQYDAYDKEYLQIEVTSFDIIHVNVLFDFDPTKKVFTVNKSSVKGLDKLKENKKNVTMIYDDLALMKNFINQNGEKYDQLKQLVDELFKKSLDGGTIMSKYIDNKKMYMSLPNNLK